MNDLFAVVLGILYGLAVYCIRQHNVVKLIIGLGILSNAVNLTIVTVGFRGASAPIIGLPEPFADPLVQAMTLTAIVIGFGVTSFALVLAYSLIRSENSVEVDEYRKLKG
ncbi:MAG: sodium:proton antiporter [Candidatus Caldarchaeum sp.]|nr:sodium:proton antiporter [Candidatus Caldarchaeum sp.]MCS7133551.1 sodium:proton antiporter [Candidatus Caldarchaeum sp.]MCX8200971.1 sodium:proton antiporter [Candidatus Caldarchaeum sp.]MDW8063644.1 sodium:proton antiporter [Candidatus Caldarchaeum sp.]MDW8436132.1 sodium:proton antiporter [Candidatus Caldarchaeum sp.]